MTSRCDLHRCRTLIFWTLSIQSDWVHGVHNFCSSSPPPPISSIGLKGRGAWGWVVGLMSSGAKNWVVRLGTSNPAFTDIFVFVYCVMFSLFLIVFQYWRRRMCQYRWLSIILACLTWRHSHSETCVADKSLLIDNTCVAWRISARVECTLCFCLPNLFSFV